MRTQLTLESICRALQENCGDHFEACRQAGVSLIFMEQWARDDTKVAERFAEAARVGNMGLVSAAIKRAVHGVDEGVWYKGSLVGTEKKYSDSLLTTLLKAKIPDFHKDADAGSVNVTVQVANVMPRAESYDAWLAMKETTMVTLANMEAAKQRALAAPIEGEYVEILQVEEPVLKNLL